MPIINDLSKNIKNINFFPMKFSIFMDENNRASFRSEQRHTQRLDVILDALIPELDILPKEPTETVLTSTHNQCFKQTFFFFFQLNLQF